MNKTFRFIESLLETQRERDQLKHDSLVSSLRSQLFHQKQDYEDLQKLFEASCKDNFHLNQRLDELKAKLALYETPEQE